MAIGSSGSSAQGITTAPDSAPTVPPPAGRLAPGSLLAGRYEILAWIGAGGMGTVYRARDHHLHEEVALKVLRPEGAHEGVVLHKLRREVKLARRITHRNVCRSFDVGQDGELGFLTMELVAGESLRALLLRGALPPARAFELVAQLAEGVAAAHAERVIHRDLKPENVLVAGGGRAVILDFGLASSVAREPSASRVHAGTRPYMSPEQLRGLPLDTRTDVFSLGVLAFEVFTGRHPFGSGAAEEVSSAILRDPPIAFQAPSLSPEAALAVEEVLRRAMAKRPEERFAGAAELREALLAARDGTARSSTAPAAIPPRGARPGWRGTASLVAMLLAAALITTWHLGARGDPAALRGQAPRAAPLARRALARGAVLRYERLVHAAPRLEHLAAGKALLDSALVADPTYIPALLARAELLMLEARSQGPPRLYREAIEVIERALAAVPGDARGLILRCRAMQRAAVVEERPTDAAIDAAFAACREAQQSAPRSGEIHAALASLHDLRCEDDWAMYSIEVALEHEPALEGRLLEHYIALALQGGRLQTADERSRRLVELEASTDRPVRLLRGGVLLRLGRLDEARAELRRELAIVRPTLGGKWSEASAIRGLLRIARMRGEPPAAELVSRLRVLEAEYLDEIARNPGFALVLAGAYQSTDPAAGAAWLTRAGAAKTFRHALAHAVFQHLAGDDAAARDALASVPAEQEWERACARKVELALAPR